MCVKWWLEKLDLRILKSITCLGLSNTEERYQVWNFGCFWWNFSNNNPICCTYQNLCMTFANVFGFLLNFWTSWKSCVKEYWPKKSLFQKCWPYVMICFFRPKRGWNIFESLKSWHITEFAKDKQSWICIQFLVKKIKILNCNKSKLNFWNRLHPKFAFLCRLLTQTANFDIKFQSNSESYDQHGIFWIKFKGGQNSFYYLRWEVFTTRDSTLGLTGWTFSYIIVLSIGVANKLAGSNVFLGSPFIAEGDKYAKI